MVFLPEQQSGIREGRQSTGWLILAVKGRKGSRPFGPLRGRFGKVGGEGRSEPLQQGGVKRMMTATEAFFSFHLPLQVASPLAGEEEGVPPRAAERLSRALRSPIRRREERKERERAGSGEVERPGGRERATEEGVCYR